MNFSLRWPLLLLVMGLAFPGCVHLHPNFGEHDGDGDSEYCPYLESDDHDGRNDHDDDGHDDDRDGLERHIRDLEETLQHLEQELEQVHRELDEAHREMGRRHDDGRDRHDGDRDRRHDDDGDRYDDDRDRRHDDDRDRRHDDDRDRHDGNRNPSRHDEKDGDWGHDPSPGDHSIHLISTEGPLPMMGKGPAGEPRARGVFFPMAAEGRPGTPPMIFGRTAAMGHSMPVLTGRAGGRGFQIGNSENRQPEGRRFDQRDRGARDGDRWGAGNRNRRIDRDRPRGRQMRPQQRVGGDVRHREGQREGRGRGQDRKRSDQDQQQMHWSGSLEEMPDHVIEMLKSLDVDVPFDRAGTGESHVEIEVIHSEHSDAPQGEKQISRRYVEVDSGKVFEIDLGELDESHPMNSLESIEWIGEHSMPREVHIMRVGSDRAPESKKASNKKKAAARKKASNKKKAAARNKAGRNQKADNKKSDKQRANKKKANKKKTDGKKTDRKKAVEMETEATIKIVVDAEDGKEPLVLIKSLPGDDMPESGQVMQWIGDLDGLPAGIKLQLEGLELPVGPQKNGIEKKAAATKKAGKKKVEKKAAATKKAGKKKVEKNKSDKKKSDKKKSEKKSDKKTDDLTLEGRIVL
ncbi:MAG: hypothetical protein VX764_10340 [Planctomycetota bacterium]|nr:hypothetical protein [Planctomycetota bacterium]